MHTCSLTQAMVATSLAALSLAGCAHAPPAPSPAPPPELHSPFTGYSSARYQDPKQWLCLPGREGDPCHGNLDATELHPDGTRTLVPEPLPEKPLPVDCFYVYPTVDMGLSPGNHEDFSDLSRITDATLAQAAHFRRVCNLYVPLYRQVTIGTYLRSPEVRERYLSVAFSDVSDAFLHYMGQFNQGRPVVLLGHSQGAEMTVRLLRRFFDADPLMQSRLLLALPIGGNLEVASGQEVGGTFAHLPVCAAGDQKGCVLGYRSIVAGASPAERDTPQPGHTSVCVEPARLLSGQPRPYARSYFLYNQRIGRHLHGAEGITTPFFLVRDLYRGECVPGPQGRMGLAISAAPGPGDHRENPIDFDARIFHGELGLHLLDFQLAQGDLIDLVARLAGEAPPSP